MWSNNFFGYFEVIKTAAREDNANSARVILSVVFSILRIFLIAAIYHVAYQTGKAVVLPYVNAIWGMNFYYIFIVNIGMRSIFKIVESEIVSGNVETNLVKPLDWRMRKVCELLGKKGIEFLVQLIVSPMILWIFIGIPDLSYVSFFYIIVFLLLVILSMVTAFSLFITIGLSAFWLNNAKSVFKIVDKIALVFSGGFVPIALLPQLIQEILRYTPFSVYANPTQFFNPAMANRLLSTLISAGVWSVGLLACCEFVWRKARHRIEVNGG